MDAREKLIVDALRFAVWAAGEGITPQDDTPEPETFLFDYATATGDEDYNTMPDRLLADSTILHDSENHGPTLERARALARGVGEAQAKGWKDNPRKDGCGGETAASNTAYFIDIAIRAMEVKP